ncbi:MAG TPA: hypothetical protein ENK91_02705, partial [Bacteroidetes bacterium]|nr:hypothetical protein [Bacteroidota bacterium]
MIHTLDKYQQEAFLKIKNSDLVLIQGKRYSGKSYLVRYYVNELWSSGLKSLIVVPDKEYAKMYLKHLGAFGLADFAFIFEKSFLQSDYYKSKINYLLNEENIPVSKKNILIKKLIYSNRLNKVNNYYDLLNTKLLNNKSLTELFIINAFDKRAFENIYFNQIIDPDKFEFSQQEYNELKANIKTAFELQLQGKKTTD